MRICFFEDETAAHFYPLALTRPVDDLRVGILTLREKWLSALDTQHYIRKTRPHLSGLFAAGEVEEGEDYLWINPRFLPDDALIKLTHSLELNEGFVSNGYFVAARTDARTTRSWINDEAGMFSGVSKNWLHQATEIHHIWELMTLNGAEIKADIQRLSSAPGKPKSLGHSENRILEHPQNIYMEQGASLGPGVIINAENGPVYLGQDAKIMAGAMIEGPVAIGAGSTVKMGAKIYENTSIGPVCKVGGEVEDTVFHSYSNKPHDGFVGHSLIGQWCNLGADTNTSDLKNNYGTIKIYDYTQNRFTDAGQQFLGTIMGDHSKTSINCMLNTGTVVGVSCNIFSGDFPPKHIPSFSWVGTGSMETYRFDKALETMQRMMGRRDVELSSEYHRMMQQVLVMSQNSG